MDTVAALENIKDNVIAGDLELLGTSTLATNAFGATVGRIGFQLDLKGRLSCAGRGHMDTDALVKSVGVANRKASQISCVGSRQIHGKQTYNLPKLGFADFPSEIPIFPNHFREFAHVEHCWLPNPENKKLSLN